MAINFPAYPNPGDTFSSAGIAWVWDGIKWWAAGLIPAYSPGIGDNRIINGDMRIDQRNNGVAGTAFDYTVDRWKYASTQAGKGQWQRAGTITPGFPYSLSFLALSAATLAATDFFQFSQPIEADMVSDFAWGTANAQPATLSFWVLSTTTGTLSGAISNDTGSRSYPFTFSVPNTGANRIVVTIPGDAAGTWVNKGNGAGVIVHFDLGSGANFRGPAGAWAATSYVGVTGAVSIATVNGGNIYFTGVKLEIGSVATPFNRQSLAKSMADCQRYYSTSNLYFGAYGLTGGNIGQTLTFPATMRAAPTITPVSSTPTNSSGLTAYQSTNMGTGFYATVTATGMASAQCGLTMSAEL